MPEEKITAHRLAAFSDAVFAVIVTVMVLELRAPDQPAFSALWPLWPTAISYAVSYLFIAIIWINHHVASVADRRRVVDEKLPDDFEDKPGRQY
jgi:uncharacterized membrane protein